ncbi:hypothetical protein FRC00_005384 [Tulasnella sp. 408]|nr:hypothetical protein FRC00_005384 [Tulasnella sp. 408]
MYIDVVGESPLILWQAQNEWDEIQSQDLSFRIRVPESIPPSLALERNAGIKYELVASMLTKGKRSLLGREATPTITASWPVIIDKHELHSAWPLYARPESRSMVLDGYTLTVNRTHQAYGPGDRIAVDTLVKSDTSQVNHIRYEFSLREHVTYKPAENQNGTRTLMAQPQTRTRAIVGQRTPMTMMPSALPHGMQVEKELSLRVPFSQTTTTISFAHHIEVQFDIRIRVILTAGPQLLLDLPIIMSNWTRAQSIDLIRLIGHTDTLRNLGGVPGLAGSPQGSPQPQIDWTLNRGPEPTSLKNWSMTAGPPFNGMAHMASGSFADGWASERLSTMSSPQQAHSVYGNEFSAIPGGSKYPSMASAMSQASFRSSARFSVPRGPRSSGPRVPLQAIPASNALDQSTSANMRRAALPPVPSGGRGRYYPFATEEMQIPSYEQATERANRTQVDVYEDEATPVPYDALYPSEPAGPPTSAIGPVPYPSATRSRSPNQGRDADVGNSSSTSPLPHPPKARFLTAMEETEQLRQIYKAQDAAARRLGDTTVSRGLGPPPYRPLDSSSMLVTRYRAPLPPPPATTGPQPMSAAQEKALLKTRYATEDAAQSKAMLKARYAAQDAAREKAMLKARYAVEDAAQNRSRPRPLPPPPRKWAASSLPPLSLAPRDRHQVPISPDFSPNDGELPLPPSFSFEAGPVTAAEENVQPRAKYAAEEGEDSSFSDHPSS